MREYIEKALQEHYQAIKDIDLERIEEISREIINCYRNKGKVVVFGNGGSAADAQHIVGELVGKFQTERESLPAIALNTNASVVTAVGNDYGFNAIFKRQIEGLVNGKDLAIGISTSGNSENVVEGLLKAKEKGAKTVGFTGKGGGKMKDIVDILLDVPSGGTPRIQEGHITAGHIICGLVEKEIFSEEEK